MYSLSDSYSQLCMHRSKAVVTLVTGNKGKAEEFKQIFDEIDPELTSLITIKHEKVDVQEIQGTPEEIIAAKARAAFATLKKPLIVDDVSLHFEGLNGLPGPYIKWFLATNTPQELHDMIPVSKSKNASACAYLAFWDGASDGPIIVKGEHLGTIVNPRGAAGFGWDPIFQPLDCSKTYAELTHIEKCKFSHRRKALENLSHTLKSWAKSQQS